MIRFLTRVFICIPLYAAGALLALSAAVLLISHFTSTPSSSALSTTIFISAFLLLLGISALWTARKHWRPNGAGTSPQDGMIYTSIQYADHNPFYASISSIVQMHRHTLKFERNSKLVPDKYGIVEPGSWDKEKREFFERVAYPHVLSSVRGRLVRKQLKKIAKQARLPFTPEALSEVFYSVVSAEIESQLDNAASDRPAIRSGPRHYNSPSEFEQWCADELCAAGWAASVVGQAGDQGVDVRAEKDGVTLALQCKFYTNAVGNSAIQEVYAGMAFHHAQLAAVVSTGGFTRQARALAERTSVHLLSPDNLRSYASSIANDVSVNTN